VTEPARGLELTFAAWKECLQRRTPRDLEEVFHDGPDEPPAAGSSGM
jgi:hypothetical protein